MVKRMKGSRAVRTAHVDSKEGVAQRLREARLNAGMSLRQLAYDGCTAPYISAIENGRRVPSLQVVKRLAQRLGVSPEWLATGSADETEPKLVAAELALRLGDAESAEALYKQLASEDSTTAVRATALAGIGEIRFQEGDTATAIAAFEEAIALTTDATRQLASAVELLGRCYALRGDLESAIALFTRSREDALAVGDALLGVRFAVLLANAYVDIGDLSGSAETLSAALRESAELADPIVRARVEWTQSRFHAVEGRSDLAAEFGRRALATLHVAEDEHAIARAQQMLAYIELDRGNASEARDLLEAARPTITRTGSALERAIFDLELARSYAALGDTDNAKALAIEIAPLLIENARGNSGRNFTVLGDIFDQTGDQESALRMYDAAIQALDDHRNPHLARAYERKASVLEAQGRKDEALDTLKLALAARTPTHHA